MIRCYIIVCLLSGFALQNERVYAQRLSGPIQEVVDAEMAFAKMSMDRGTKEAFIKFLDIDAVGFVNGEPVNGLELWKKKTSKQRYTLLATSLCGYFIG